MKTLILLLIACAGLSAQVPQDLSVPSYDPSHETIMRIWIENNFAAEADSDGDDAGCEVQPVTVPCRISADEAQEWMLYKLNALVADLQNRAVNESGSRVPAALPAAVRARKQQLEEAEQADRAARRKAVPPAEVRKRVQR